MPSADREAWRSAIDQLPSYSFFATPLCGGVLDERGLGYRCTSLSIDLGEIQVFLPVAETNRVGLALRESMPFGTYGGALISSRARTRISGHARGDSAASCQLIGGWGIGRSRQVRDHTSRCQTCTACSRPMRWT